VVCEATPPGASGAEGPPSSEATPGPTYRCQLPCNPGRGNIGGADGLRWLWQCIDENVSWNVLTNRRCHFVADHPTTTSFVDIQALGPSSPLRSRRAQDL